VKTFTCVKTVVASLLLASAADVWALPPTYHYGTSATALANGPIAITTTVPTSKDPRAGFVVAAEANASNDLEVIAWQDTTAKLTKAGTPGVVQGPGLFSVGITGLDSSRVVTADIDYSGTLSINTWTVGTAGVVKQAGFSTPANTAYQNVAIAAVSSTEVVTAYQLLGGNLAVEAWTISAAGVPTAKALIGSGPLVDQLSIATVNSNEVVTAANDNNNSLWVTTWVVDSAGVQAQSQVEKTNVVSRLAEDVGIGAGEVFRLTNKGGIPFSETVRSAFTPIINIDGNVEVFDWAISPAGVLSQTNTPVKSSSLNNFEVAACMLAANTPITAFGNDDGSVNIGWYGSALANYSATPPKVPTDGISTLAASAAGTDYSVLHPFGANAYFVTAANTYYGSSDVGTLEIREYSYPYVPTLF
jgi:hypothetical protein